MDGHWLVFDEFRRITGCHCGETASEGDQGYGDSIVKHLIRVGLAVGLRTPRPADLSREPETNDDDSTDQTQGDAA